MGKFPAEARSGSSLLSRLARPDLDVRKFPHDTRGRSISFADVGSTSGFRGRPRAVAYTAAKGGVLALTRQAALDLGKFGITVNAVAPANVLTPRTLTIRTPERIAHIEKTTPVGRLGSPEEIAAAVFFLASNDASYVTGTTLKMDGGLI